MRVTSVMSVLLGCAIVASFAACKSTNAIPNTISVQKHLYVTDDSGNIQVYDLPLTASSTPSLTLAGAACNDCGIAVSHTKLYVGQGSSVKVYQLPLTASSTPIQTLTASGSTTLSVTADSSGTIYVAEDDSGTCCVDVYQGGASSPTFTLSGASVDDPFGVAIDGSGNAFVANASNIGYFAATVHSGEAGITFGRDNFNEGLVTDSGDNLYVADGDGHGTMDIYHPSYTGATTVANTVTLNAGYLEQMVVGSNGTMYIANETPNQLDVLTSPYTSIALAVPTTFEGYGMAIGP